MNDEINNPSHYMLFPDMEAIDVIKAALTQEEFAGYCKGNALKYRLRAGEKGPVEKCIAKACWYQNKLREVTRAEFGQQNTIDCRTDAEKGFNDPRTVAGSVDRCDQILRGLAAEAEWDAAESRMDVVGQNGPSAEHYAEVPHE